MKKQLWKKMFLLVCLLASCGGMDASHHSVEYINRAWKYQEGDKAGAEKLNFNDEAWQQIGLPHSFSIPYFRNSAFYTGYGWYRKILPYQSVWKGKRVHIDFDGVFQVAEVYLNEKLIGTHEGGYTGFTFDITDQLRPGDNLLAVRVNNLWSATLAPRAGEHVFSGGIYRDVSLRVTDAVHVAWNGTFVTTPEVSEVAARVKVITEVVNSSSQTVSCVLHNIVKDKSGKPIAAMETDFRLEPGANQQVEQLSDVISCPELWTPETPVLYTVETLIEQGGKSKSSYQTRFGFRWLEWTADQGLFVNGKHYYLEGANVHQDHAGWGDAVTQAGIYRDVKMMKDAGFNFIRGSHYPHHPYFAQVCDELGLFYMSENVFWGIGGFGVDGYWNCSAYPVKKADEEPFAQSLEKSLQEMIRINRNSPSILAWSMSNEAFFSPGELMPQVKVLMSRLVNASHQYDPTRIALIGGCQRGELDVLGDAAGYNGDGATLYIQPGIPSMVSEYGSCVADRPGEYEPCWGNITDHGAKPAWRIGHAIWCGFDHGSIAGEMGKMGIVDFFRIPKRAWYWYRNHYLGIAPPEWPKDGVPTTLRLTADKERLNAADGTDDALITVTVLDAAGKHISNSPQVTLTLVSGPGEFPTGRSITFRPTTGDDIRILDGQAAIEFRSYEGGKTRIRATSAGLKEAWIELESTGTTYIEGVTPMVQDRPYVVGTKYQQVEKRERVVSEYRPTRASSTWGKQQSLLANDNNADTFWQPNRSESAPWWWLDMENFYQVSKVSLKGEGGSSSFLIQVSEDGKQWKTIGQGKMNDINAAPLEINCQSETYALYLRILFSDVQPNQPVILKEISVIGRSKE